MVFILIHINCGFDRWYSEALVDPLLISTLTALPITYYFWGANNEWKLVGLTPILLLLLTIIIKKKRIQH